MDECKPLAGGRSQDESYLASLVKLHHVTLVWRGEGTYVDLVGDVAGGWTHTLSMTKQSDDAPHTVTCILPTGRGLHSFTFRLNVSAFCGIEGAFRGCLRGVHGVFIGC